MQSPWGPIGCLARDISTRQSFFFLSISLALFFSTQLSYSRLLALNQRQTPPAHLPGHY